MKLILVIAGLFAAAAAKDLIVGHEGGSVIFSQNITASPAIWRQTRNLTVNCTEHEVITRVVVIDNREDKNGEAAIVEGGEGFKTVTIELKSPAIFRGYDFEVQVYAKHEDSTQKPVHNEQQIPQGVIPEIFDDAQKPQQHSEDVLKGFETPLPTLSSTHQVANTQGGAQAPKDDKPTVSSAGTTQVPNGQKEIQIPKEGQDTVDLGGTQQETQQVNQQETQQVNQQETQQVGQQETQQVNQQETQQVGQHETQQVNQHETQQVSQQESQQETQQVSQQEVQHPGASVHEETRPVWETREEIQALPKGFKKQ